MNLLTVSAIARDRGWNRMRAWRWLRKIERLHGAKLSRHPTTRQIGITRDELQRVTRREEIARDPAAGLRDLLDRVEALESRQNGMARELSEMRRVVARVTHP